MHDIVIFLLSVLSPLKHGKEYTHLYYPHAHPATVTGHAALSTGTTASHHGLIANEWYENGIKKACDDPDHVSFDSSGKQYTGKYGKFNSTDTVNIMYYRSNTNDKYRSVTQKSCSYSNSWPLWHCNLV